MVHRTMAVLFMAIGVTAGVLLTNNLGATLGVICYWIGWCLVGVLVVNAVLQDSDVVIDQNGISRTLFGRTWKSVEWTEVERVHVRSLWSLDLTKKVNVICFDRTSEAQPKHLRARRFAFSDAVEGAAELVQVLNSYISKHRLVVEVTSNGATTRSTQL